MNGFSKTASVLAILACFTTLSMAASGNWTNTNSTDSFNIETGDINQSVSVNQFGYKVSNISAKYLDNLTQSRTFQISVSGNASQILETPDAVTLFENQSSGFPLIANVPESQSFGDYRGNLSLTGQENSNFSDSINVSLNVFDNIEPEIKSADVDSVQATESVTWSVVASDNLNVSSVSGEIIKESLVEEGNQTVLQNSTLKTASFEENSEGAWTYTFSDTGEISDYYLNLTAEDSSGNSVSLVESFEVSGLDSINVFSSNFVFDTIQTKDDTGFELVESSIEGKEFNISLDNLTYGGNETVQIGVLPPESESPEIVGTGETSSFSKKGGYELVLIHTGSNEVEGTHTVTGSLTVEKPSNHVSPVSVDVDFSGTVKNLDKPPEKCLRVAEFDSCVAYSLDQAQSLFDDEYGVDQGDRSFAYLIGRIPTSDVEGSSEWGDESSLTFGEFEEQKQEINSLESELDRKVEPFWRALSLFLIFAFGGVFAFMYKVYPTFEFENARFAERKLRKLRTGGN